MTTPVTGEPTIQASLVAYLLSLPEVQEMCGGRVYPRQRTPGKALPCVTFFTISHARIRTLDNGPCGMGNPHIQLDVWAKTEKECRRLEWAVRGTKERPRLDGLMGRMGSHNVTATVNDAHDLDEPPAGGEETGVYRVSLDVSLLYDEQPLA